MASVVNTYKVHYHFEQAGKKAGVDYIDYIEAANMQYGTLQSVLSSNNKLRLGTLVIDNAQEIGRGDNAIA